MLGISYGELFLIIGATAALVGPKDLPIIARTAGRLAGRAIGYVQLARGQFDSILQQSQARQVHKELQDTMAQLEAIRHEVRTISFINPGPLTRRLVDNIDHAGPANGYNVPPEAEKVNTPSMTNYKDYSSTTPSSSTMHCQAAAYERLGEPATFNSANVHSRATAYERLAESAAFNSGVSESNEVINELTDESGLLVLPVSAESTGLLPNRRDDTKGSDIVLEAVMEAEVARNAKEFFTQPQNRMKSE